MNGETLSTNESSRWPPFDFELEYLRSLLANDNSSSWLDLNYSLQIGDVDYVCSTLEGDAEISTSSLVYLYLSLTFILTGLIGNSLSIAVFSSRSLRDFSSSVYLLALAVSDLLYLLSVLLGKLLTLLRCAHFPGIPVDLFNTNPATCKLLQYLSDLFADYSTCIVLAFTVERYLACYEPLRFKVLCTARRAKGLCGVGLVVIAALVAPYHFMYIGVYEFFNVCAVLQEYVTEFTLLYMSEATLFRVIPITATAILNVLIIVNITKLSHQQQKRRHSPPLASDVMLRVLVRTHLNINTNSNKNNNNNIDDVITSPAADVTTLRLRGRVRRLRHLDKNVQLTITLILVSSTHVLVFTPVLVHFFFWTLEHFKLVQISVKWLYVAQNYTRALYVFGVSISFFLYTISGQVFRQQLQILTRDFMKRIRCR